MRSVGADIGWDAIAALTADHVLVAAIATFRSACVGGVPSVVLVSDEHSLWVRCAAATVTP